METAWTLLEMKSISSQKENVKRQRERASYDCVQANFNRLSQTAFVKKFNVTKKVNKENDAQHPSFKSADDYHLRKYKWIDCQVKRLGGVHNLQSQNVYPYNPFN